MKLHLVFERANDGRIWAYSPNLESAIVGNGATVEEARSSLFEGIELAREHGDPIGRASDIVAVEIAEVA